MLDSTPIVYLNGDYLPRDQACVSVLDRGFLFGDGVYEVIPCYGGRLFHPVAHLDRLSRSLSALRIENPLSRQAWLAILDNLLKHGNQGTDCSFYLQVTRGSAPRNHAFPVGVKPCVFVMVDTITPLPDHFFTQGIKAITLKDQRWQRCDIKAITLLANVLARQEAIDAGAVEAILIRDGWVTEGAASNLFMVADQTLMTPPKDHQLLPGITRDVVVDLARQAGIEVKEVPIAETELAYADEIWLTSSTRDILPVTQLNNEKLGNGKPGALWQQLYPAYNHYKLKEDY